MDIIVIDVLGGVHLGESQKLHRGIKGDTVVAPRGNLVQPSVHVKGDCVQDSCNIELMILSVQRAADIANLEGPGFGGRHS